MLEYPNNYYQFFDQTGTPESKIENLLRKLAANPQAIGVDNLSLGLDMVGAKLSYLDFYLERGGELIIGEIKNHSPINREEEQVWLEEIQNYIAATKASKAILVIPGSILNSTRNYFEKHNIEVWDLNKIYELDSIKNKVCSNDTVAAI